MLLQGLLQPPVSVGPTGALQAAEGGPPGLPADLPPPGLKATGRRPFSHGDDLLLRVEVLLRSVLEEHHTLLRRVPQITRRADPVVYSPDPTSSDDDYVLSVSQSASVQTYLPSREAYLVRAPAADVAGSTPFPPRPERVEDDIGSLEIT